jgi:phosphate:Na+ symporter
MNALAFTMAMSVIGGLGIFMLGMKYMSEGMQAVAGNSLRRMIALVTGNRFTATAVGTGVTVLVQSSTVTTVLVVGLVNAGLMQLYQAVGVILGANVGTTITGWILVLQIGKYGLPILGIAALVFVFARRDRPRFIAMAVMGMGMVFFGLELMKDGFAPMKDMPAFIEAFAWFRADTYFGIVMAAAVGCVLTLVVQSSSATLGITIGLAATGVIPFTTAAALVLGENLGTTITVVLAGIGANTNARRAAAAHVVFNLVGVIWIILLFPWYSRLIAGIIQSIHGADPMTIAIGDFADPTQYAAVITAGIALTHTGFNVSNTLLFLPFLRPYSRFLERLVPGPGAKEVSHLRHVDARGVNAPVLGIEQSRGQVAQMGEGVGKMMEWIRELAFQGEWNERLMQKTLRREEVLDKIQREMVEFLTDVLDATVPHAVAQEGRQQFRIAHEYESMSDRLASVLKAFAELRKQRITLPEAHGSQLADLHDAIAAFLHDVTGAYAARRTLDDVDARARNTAIDAKIRQLQDHHLQYMIDNSVDPVLTMAFTGILTDYRRVRAHVLNIHQTMVGSQATVGV